MTDRQDAADPPATPPADADDGADRRAFLRSLPRSAFRTAEQLVGISSIMRRSVVAVGETLIGSVEPQPEEGPPPAPGVANLPAAANAAEVAPPLPTAHDPVAGLTSEQHALLGAGTSLVIAANDPAGSPHLTASPYHWDGTTFRVPGRLSSARAIAIDRDPRVSLLIDGADPEAWVAVTGVATLGPIDLLESDMLEIFGADAAAGRWDEMRLMGDWIVIHVRPTRFVWRIS